MKLTEAAYKKAMAAADSIESLFSVSDKILRVIAYVFEKLEEVTPLMLQKLLYFIQGVYSALYGKPVFVEDCRAWVHGPVYPEVYDLFRDFKYNPIDDARFALLDGTEDALTDEERRVIDLVANTFGFLPGGGLFHFYLLWPAPSGLITKDFIARPHSVLAQKDSFILSSVLRKFRSLHQQG